MKINAHIYLSSPERLSAAQMHLKDCAYPSKLTFGNVHRMENDVLEVPFCYESKYAKCIDNLVYFFVDFVTSAATCQNIKVWFDFFVEAEND